MTASIVVLVEEPSARVVVDALCGTLGMGDHVRVLQHEGKNDLEKSITRKINGWRSPVPARFIISMDLDSADRAVLKAGLLALVPDHARERTKIRIVVPELEAWYLGDPIALSEAGLIPAKTANHILRHSRFRNLCHLQNAKMELKKFLKEPIGAIGTAHAIGPRLLPDRNRSVNFKAFVAALRWAGRAMELQ